MRIHGEWKINLVGDVLVRSTAGQFNIEGTKACSLEAKKIVPKNTPWAYLGNASNWEMSGEESFKLFPTLIEWALNNGCQYGAIVLPNIILEKLYKEYTNNITGNKFQYFKTLEEACEWLTSKGFAISPKDYPHYEFIARTKIKVNV